MVITPEEEVKSWEEKVHTAGEILQKKHPHTNPDPGMLMVASAVLAVGIDIMRAIQRAEDE